MKKVVFFTILTLICPFKRALAAQEAELNAKVGNFVAFFKEDKKIRHERWEFWAKQSTSFGLRLKTVVEGRLWWDMALMDNDYAARRDYPKVVRDDELFEGEARNLYVDYLGDFFHLKAGRQIIDWTGSPSPTLFDMLTPMDVRHGVAYAATDLIVPVNAVSLTHDFVFDGSLEWLVIPQGEHHRLAKGDNGYGYYAFLKSQVAPRQLVLTDEPREKEKDDAEFGLRYQATLSSVDFTLLGYRGRQKSPSFLVDAQEKSVIITQKYPRVNTFGTSMAYAQDAWVGRFMTFYEPKRELRILSVDDDFDSDSVYDRKILLGVGFDWVFSRHLKIYTEQYGQRLETVVPSDPTDAEDSVSGAEDTYVGLFKVTNETIDGVMLSVETIFTAPDKSRMITPAIEIDFWDNYKFMAGARLIKSDHPDSRFESLKDSSHYFARIESKIDVGRTFGE